MDFKRESRKVAKRIYEELQLPHNKDLMEGLLSFDTTRPIMDIESRTLLSDDEKTSIYLDGYNNDAAQHNAKALFDQQQTTRWQDITSKADDCGLSPSMFIYDVFYLLKP